MKEFLIYTGLRLALLVGTFVVVGGIWLLVAGELNWFYTLLISFLVSGVVSYLLLDQQRAAFARRVEARATKATEAMRTKED